MFKLKNTATIYSATTDSRNNMGANSSNKKSKIRNASAGLLAFLFSMGAIALAVPDSPNANQANVEQADNTQNSVQETQTDNTEVELLNTTEGSKVETRVESRSSVTSNGETSVDLTVNGQPVPVPENGSLEQTITTNDSQTKVQVNVRSSSATEKDSDSDTRIRIRSDVDSNIDIRSNSP